MVSRPKDYVFDTPFLFLQLLPVIIAMGVIPLILANSVSRCHLLTLIILSWREIHLSLGISGIGNQLTLNPGEHFELYAVLDTNNPKLDS